MTLRHPRPPVLERLGDAHCVIEASAGTGKTFTIEHLVVDLVLKGIPLERILVVTFTVKATQELRTRIRAKLQELVDLEVDDPTAESCWDLGEKELDALRAALLSFDRASISTIHGFCQQVLQDGAFESGRLFTQEQVSAEEAFDHVFKNLVRTRFAVGGETPFFQRVLDAAGGLPQLADFLRQLLKEKDALYQEGLDDLQGVLDRCDLDEARALLEEILLYRSVKDPKKRTQGPRVAALAQGGYSLAQVHHLQERLEVLLEIVPEHKASGFPDLLWQDRRREKLVLLRDYLGKGAAHPGLRELAGTCAVLARDFLALAGARYLPPLRDALSAYKRDQGFFDFGDMIELVHEGLLGPQGSPMVDRLRERFQVALIDEFQDTDHLQWDIFRRVFLEGPGQRLILVGDPKQAIYGFRSGDLPTYLRAVEEVKARTGRDPEVLDTNFRSTGPLIQAYCQVFEGAPGSPFFTEGNAGLWKGAVACGKRDLALTGPDGTPLPAIRVLETPGDKPARARKELAGRLAQVLRETLEAPPLFGRGDKAAPIRPEDIFVLTRTAAEGLQVAEALRGAGVPYAFFKQEGLFGTEEAKALRDLLVAIDAPLDEGARGRALLGPFFGLTFAETEACRELPETHPILRRLHGWRDLARERRYGDLFARILSESGVTQRLLFLEEGERVLTNVQHLAELLLAEAVRRHGTLRDLATVLQRWIDGLERPAVEDGDVQRLEREGGAVQILTMHKSKGLEAVVVAVYGGISTPRSSGAAYRYHDEALRRQVWVGGKDGAPGAIADAIAREDVEEWERLLYVALTRAKGQLILPHFTPAPPARGGNRSFHPEGDPKGPYGCVNRRLRNLLPGEAEPVPHPAFRRIPPPGTEPPPPPPVQARLATWNPQLPEPAAEPDFAALAQAGRPLWSFSYTSLERGLRERRDPADAEERTEMGYTPTPGDGPSGGARLGTLVHDLLEVIPLDSFGNRTFEAWRQDPAIQALLREIPREALTHVARWAWHALNGPLPLPDGTAAVLAQAGHVLRELAFLTPYPGRQDLLNGSMDVLFQWQGRAYVLDWKTDRSPAFDPETLGAAVQEKYRLQLMAYTVTACRFLGFGDEATYEAGFGGFLYVFLRGLPEEGVWTTRPTWTQVQRWEDELRRLDVESLIPAHAGGGRHA
ncbi:UvrD-helicase domain-containing protein [Mesoterricola silvestris]|uniref:DNA 3'-5' helicase n=1 Tax=Mesoterricola silvestris TaxID=2927979 RepID=A0AA48K9K9_9BACT|nr:UvrD-helicase domain-containing protein [Mesoterricola silvestris]BDU73175.1 RecBCD enzyme subunit RecB [Mesoterricola silvestris]